MAVNLLTLCNRCLHSYRGLSKSCWLGISISFIQSVMIGIYYYLSSYFIQFQHLAVDISGYILSCYGVGAVLGGLVGGYLVDRYSPVKVAALFLLLQASAYIMLLIFSSVILLMATVGVLGLSTYGFLTANHVAVLNTCAESEADRLKAINILAMMSNLGLGVAALIISQTNGFGYHHLFAGAGGILLLVSGLLFTHEMLSHSGAAVRSRAKNQPAQVESARKIAASQQSTLLIILVCVFLVGIVVTQFGTMVPVQIQTTYPALGVTGASWLFALNASLVVILGVPLGNVLKQRNKVLMVGVGALLMGLSLCLLGLSHVYALVLLSCVIYTIGEIIFFSMAQLVCYQSTPAEKRGRGLGVYRMIYAASRITGPAVGGFLLMRGGVILWIVCGVFGVISFTLCLAINQVAPSASE